MASTATVVNVPACFAPGLQVMFLNKTGYIVFACIVPTASIEEGIGLLDLV